MPDSTSFRSSRRIGLRAGLAAAAAYLASGCSATAALDAVVASDTYTLREGLPYGPDPRHKLDVYLPLQAVAGGAPVVLFFYGGNWSSGERGAYRFVGESLAQAGVVAIVADYRLSPAVRWQAILDDCARAARWVFDNAASLGGDPRRIHLMGHSAGAYNAAMLALDARWLAAHGLAPTRLAGWIGVAGPYDFLPIGDPRTRVAFGWPDAPAASQPIHHVSGSAPRALLLAAAQDGTVNPQRSTVGLGERLRAAGAPVAVELFGGVSHTTVIGAMARPLAFLAPVRERVLAFVGAS